MLRKLFADHRLAELNSFDANALPDDKVHFGYRDGIAQPRIKGAPGRQPPDMQPMVDPGEFLLGRGYTNHYHGNYLGSLPEELCGNATYAALRVIRQEVKAFEDFITLMGRRWGLDKEFIAAKLMGRWRNGNPLTVIPDQYDPTVLPRERLNNFDFCTQRRPRGVLRRPRRTALSRSARTSAGSIPVSGSVMGIQYGRRIIRRAMPYGPPYVPHADNEGAERGLVGFFICGDLETQFEYVLRTWANMDFATIGVKGTRDPILGWQPPDGGQFFVRTAANRDAIVLDNLPRLTVTRGSAYCLMPGLARLEIFGGSLSRERHATHNKPRTPQPQLQALLAQAADKPPATGFLAWKGRIDFPNGTDRMPSLAQRDFEEWFLRLQNAALVENAIPSFFAPPSAHERVPRRRPAADLDRRS